MFVQGEEGGRDHLIPRANSIDIQFRLVLGDRRLRRDVAFITARGASSSPLLLPDYGTPAALSDQ